MYANNSLELNFSVINPPSWIYEYGGIMPISGKCWAFVSLDGDSNFLPFEWTFAYVSNYTVTYSNLTSGTHEVGIKIEVDAYYASPNSSSSSIVLCKLRYPDDAFQNIS